MRTSISLPILALLVSVPAAAHHGWGSYDASRTTVIEGPIQTLRYTNPHATVTVKADGKMWTITLAPISRMQTRGAPAALLAVGKTLKAEGYVSKVDPDEMRAERITVDGKTVEMR